jgi:hypothetical protein
MQSRRAFLLCSVLLLNGCSAWNPWKVRSQSPEQPDPEHPPTRLVGDLAVPFELYPVAIQGVGLVTGLKGTGSDPKPSPERSILMGEMQTRGVKNPNAILSSGETSLVMVRGVLRPGIQKGDRFDIEVRVPARSETSSLRGGWLLETRLKEMAVLDDNQLHTGHLLGLAQGAILVDPSADPKAKDSHVLLCRGRILGGGVALKSRPLSLVLRPDHKSVANSYRIETVVNKRFTNVQKGIKVGVAKAETDQVIKLTVHPRYKDNIERYVDVIRSVALKESEPERIERLKLLEKQLLDPIASARAALQLEAIGQEGVETLKKGIQSSDPEVRFRAAEALAYLDRSEAAVPLAEAARQQPAFRVFALAALGAMNDFAAYEQLKELLNVLSVETRYGAFRALTAMNANDPLVMGESLGGQFSYHVLDASGPPLIHVTRSRRPEVVLFGLDQQLRTPLALEAGHRLQTRRDRRQQVHGQRAGSETGGFQPDRRGRPGDRRAGWNLPRCGAGPPAGQSQRRAGQPVRDRCPSGEWSVLPSSDGRGRRPEGRERWGCGQVGPLARECGRVGFHPK